MPRAPAARGREITAGGKPGAGADADISQRWQPIQGCPRRIPSFRIRAWSVVRLRPRRAAAPRGPLITQLVA